jgi:hypothetical protein
MQRPPKVLYHYTDQNGLLGIVRDGVVWATSISYLNDAREFNYAKELLDNVLATSGKHLKGKYDELCEREWWPELDAYPQVFVFSLSEHADGLGLWRAYGGSAAVGYSIGFRATDLEEKAGLADVGFVLRKCCYDEEEQRKMLLELLEIP